MDIIQVIIFIIIVAVAIVQQISKAAQKEKTVSPKEVLADRFPEIEAEEEKSPAAPVPVMDNVRPLRKPDRPVTVCGQKKATVQPAARKENPADIKLNTRKEARRAFIYSEIFNRKY